MIEDQEMSELFRLESEEHLQHLEQGLLGLEKDPRNRGLMEELFREAHSLKGASRMLGLSGVEALAHRFEELLGRVAKGERLLTPAIFDVMYRCLDSMRRLAREAVTGEASGVAVAAMLSLLRPEVLDGLPLPEALIAPVGEEEKAPSLPGPREPGDGSPAAGAAGGEEGSGPEADENLPPLQWNPSEPFLIDTVRVGTQKLDLLMAQAGELAVVKQRVARCCLNMDALLEKWERASGGSGVRGVEPEEDDLRRDFARALGSLRNQLHEDGSRLAAVAGDVGAAALEMRLLPLSTVFNLFPRLVRDLSRQQGKEARLLLLGGETEVDKRVLEEIKAPLTHIIRNAVDHGMERAQERIRSGKAPCGAIVLRGARRGSEIVIEVEDDGRGLDCAAIRDAARKSGQWSEEALEGMEQRQLHRLIFTPGLSTTPFVSDLSGRGVGLDVVRCNVERLKGKVAVPSPPGGGCTVRISLPVTLATLRALIVREGDVEYALPVEHVVKSFRLNRGDSFSVDGRPAVRIEQGILSLASLSALLPCRRTDFVEPQPDRHREGAGQEHDSCIVLQVGEERFAVVVDELLEEQEVVLKPQSALLKQVPGTAGATILDTGRVCMILHPPELLLLLRRAPLDSARAPAAPPAARKSILVVDDSLTTRTQLKRVVERAGYDVVTAVDGLDALSKLAGRPFDALITDVTMPRMDGLTLTAKVRRNENLKELPVILVTMLVSEEDRRKGLEAGANAYITKPAFEQKLLLDTLMRLA